MLTRLEAIQDINLGRGIQLRFVGHTHADGRQSTFNVILRRVQGGSGCEAVIECRIMRRCYVVKLTTKQVLYYIRRHYPKYEAYDSDVITLNRIPVAAIVTVAA